VDIKKEIIGYEAVIMLSSTTTINEDAEVLSELKTVNPRLKTICYGTHATFMPSHTLQKPGIDVAIRREPELIIKDLLDGFSENNSWKKTRGISFKENGNVISNPDYPFIEDLDILPVPDRTLLSKDVKYFNFNLRRE
jgi:radical SAM superfamily enzyme YgiQ (UPF0313 family)